MTWTRMRATTITAALAGMLVLAVPALRGDDAKDKDKTDPNGPTERGIRMTPGMARAIGKSFSREVLRHYGLDETAQSKAADLIARRVMEATRAHDEQAQAFAEYAIEALISGDGRFTADSSKRWAELSNDLLPAFRQLATDIAQDVRPLVPADKKMKFNGDLIKFSLAIDAYDQQMQRWAKGEFKEHENPFSEAERASRGEDPNASNDPEGDARRAAESMLEWETTRSWRHYVDRAISYYKLDDAQKRAAEAVLAEMEQRSQQTMDANWREKYLANRTKQQLSWRGGNLWFTPWMWRIEREADRLLRPINDLKWELFERIEEIPTAAQRTAADKAVEDDLKGAAKP